MANNRDETTNKVMSVAGIYDTILLKNKSFVDELEKQKVSLCIMDALANDVILMNHSSSDETLQHACAKARSALYWQGFTENRGDNFPSYEEIIKSVPFKNMKKTVVHPTRDGLIIQECHGNLLGAIGLSLDDGTGFEKLNQMAQSIRKETCKQYMQDYIRNNSI